MSAIAPRAVVALPPTGWRPPPLKVSAKLDIVIRQEGKCAITGHKLGTLRETRFDHRPPVHEREWDEAAQNTIPPANAVTITTDAGERQLIFAIDRRKHEVITGADNMRMSKVDRLRERTTAHDKVMQGKAPGVTRPRIGSIPSRPFQKRVPRFP